MDRLTLVMTVFSIGLIAVILVSVRKEHIRVESSVSWLLAAIVLLVLTSSRDAMTWVAELFGVADPVSALLIMWGAVFIAVLYGLSIRLSKLKDSNIALAQQVAILEYRLQSFGKNSTTGEEDKTPAI
jgi:hypothetical protein